MSKNLIAALDIGGTKVMAALMRLQGHKLPKILKQLEQPTARGGSEAAKKQILGMLESVTGEQRVARLSLAVPGPLNPKTGVLIKAPNLPGWENLPIRRWVEAKFKRPALLENDANAAALAEALWGAGKKYRYVFYTTISTGIGTGLVLDKKLYTGRTGMAMEGGHLTINHSGTLCGCGLSGCIEAYASGTSLARRARARFPREPEKWNPKALAASAAKGDESSRELIRETGRYLGIWLGNIVNLLDPDVMVLGGGLSFLGEPLFSVIRAELPKYSINPRAKEIPLIPARLKREVGLYGAAAVAFSSLD